MYVTIIVILCQVFKYSLVRVNCKMSISELPKEIEQREELGHWEMDTVGGGKGGNKEVLLVLSERCSRKELIYKISTS